MNNHQNTYTNGTKGNARPRRRRSNAVRFLRTMLITVGVLLLVAAGGLYAWAQMMGRDADLQALANAIGSNLKDGGSIQNMFASVPKRTNFLIMGVDNDGTRTDFMMVGTFNADTDELTLISIPRDAKVTIPKDRRDLLREREVWPPAPSSGVVKLTEVYHYATEKYGVEYTTKQIEELLGITIEYYVKMDLEAFRYIIDEIDGVEFDVPQRMYYRDSSQDLYIDLYPGLQTLNGEQAEGLIRYRKPDLSNPISAGYALGDVTRTEIQQQFMKELLTQLLAKDDIVKNAPAMLSTFVNYVKTNFNPTDLPKYMSRVKNLNMNSIITYTLPGTDATVNGKSYFIVDEDAASALVTQVFYSNDNAVDSDEPVPSIGKSIKVLNGSDVAGLAGRTSEMLEEEGFKVSEVGDYTGTRAAYTRIFVRTAREGADLQALLPGSQIEVKPSAVVGCDILIVLGEE